MKRWMTALGTLAVTMTNARCAPLRARPGEEGLKRREPRERNRDASPRTCRRRWSRTGGESLEDLETEMSPPRPIPTRSC